VAFSEAITRPFLSRSGAAYMADTTPCVLGAFVLLDLGVTHH
jgi:hypothetical protein